MCNYLCHVAIKHFHRPLVRGLDGIAVGWRGVPCARGRGDQERVSTAHEAWTGCTAKCSHGRRQPGLARFLVPPQHVASSASLSAARPRSRPLACRLRAGKPLPSVSDRGVDLHPGFSCSSCVTLGNEHNLAEPSSLGSLSKSGELYLSHSIVMVIQ